MLEQEHQQNKSFKSLRPLDKKKKRKKKRSAPQPWLRVTDTKAAVEGGLSWSYHQKTRPLASINSWTVSALSACANCVSELQTATFHCWQQLFALAKVHALHPSSLPSMWTYTTRMTHWWQHSSALQPDVESLWGLLLFVSYLCMLSPDIKFFSLFTISYMQRLQSLLIYSLVTMWPS